MTAKGPLPPEEPSALSPTARGTIRAPAKLNLRLKVLGARPNGYHDLVSFLVPVDLCDTLDYEITEGEGVVLEVSGDFSCPPDPSNLAWRAAELFFRETSIREALRLRLHKGIPPGAGLGGGSSDAAAVLRMLNEAHGLPLSTRRLEALAAILGADVPFFLRPRPSLATGIGERLEPVTGWPPLWYVILWPRIMVPTRWAYAALDAARSRAASPNRKRGWDLTGTEYPFIKGLLVEGVRALNRILENDFEAVTCSRYPLVGELRDRLKAEGAAGSLMTGSGSAVFGIFLGRKEAQEALERMRQSESRADIFLAPGIS